MKPIPYSLRKARSCRREKPNPVDTIYRIAKETPGFFMKVLEAQRENCKK